MTKSYRYPLLAVLAVAALGTGGATLAAIASELFSAQAIVEDTSDEAREDGIAQALSRVLVRVTGIKGADERPELAALLESAAAYVQSYRYERAEDQTLLAVTFDGDAVQQAVANAGMPVWGSERPHVMVWLALDYGRGRRGIVAADSDSQAASEVRAAALDRGLPVSLPLMDAQDRSRISFADIWGGFTEAVEEASSRYAPDAILLGRARRLATGRISVDWTLRFSGAGSSGRGDLRQGVDLAADYFAGQFAIRNEGNLAGPVTLEVSGLREIDAYARVFQHLEQLSVVDRVRLSALDGEAATFELELRGSREQLRRSLALGDILEERKPEAGAPPADPVLRYRPAL